jgi:hypothetical protein
MRLYSNATIDHSFLVLTVISMLAILCLPRQFHVAVVENTSPRDLALARWAFPLYLAMFTVFVVPIAAAGIITQGSGANADGFLLSLPMAERAGRPRAAGLPRRLLRRDRHGDRRHHRLQHHALQRDRDACAGQAPRRGSLAPSRPGPPPDPASGAR